MQWAYFEEVTRSPAHVTFHCGHVSHCDVVRTQPRPLCNGLRRCLLHLQVSKTIIGIVRLDLLPGGLTLLDDLLALAGTTLKLDLLLLFFLL